MIGMRSGMGTKYGADKADPGATGALKSGMEGTKKKRRGKRKAPTNIKGLKKQKG